MHYRDDQPGPIGPAPIPDVYLEAAQQFLERETARRVLRQQCAQVNAECEAAASLLHQCQITQSRAAKNWLAADAALRRAEALQDTDIGPLRDLFIEVADNYRAAVANVTKAQALHAALAARSQVLTAALQLL